MLLIELQIMDMLKNIMEESDRKIGNCANNKLKSAYGFKWKFL